jgi:hypothetical protein
MKTLPSPRRLASALALVLTLATVPAMAQAVAPAAAPAAPAAAVAPAAPAVEAASSYQYIVDPENSLDSIITDNKNDVLLNVGFGGWAPKWGWSPAPDPKDMATNGHLTLSSTFVLNKKNDDSITVGLDGSASAPTAVTYKYTLTATKDVPITYVVADIQAPDKATSGTLTVTSDGKDEDQPFPIGVQTVVPNVSAAVFHLATGDIKVTFDPPSPIAYQKSGFRLLLASDTVKTGATTVAATYTFPKPVKYLATQDEVGQFIEKTGDGWFAWNAEDHAGASVFDMADWLDAPAGKHGGVRMVGDQFQFEDKTPVKFWGTNLAYGSSAPEHAVAEQVATRFARYGVNAVRMHKFTGAGWEGIGDPNDVTKLDDKGLERLDYFANELTKRGVYYGFSHTFNMRVRPGNKGQLLAYDEIVAKNKGETMGLINFAPDIQDLLIQSVVNLLQHKNPYTGKTYAEDPALCYIELQNEDDILFYVAGHTYAECPTYAAKFRETFADWLTARYKTQEAFAQAWGDGLKPNETLAAKNVDVAMNPWNFQEPQLAKDSPGQKTRALDTALFLHDTQNAFYSKFVKAIRDAGYKGPLCGSPWQAPAIIPHYLNLRSDYLVGYIDRHNYYGGKNVLDTMLETPGSGYLSSGLQQVADRPFGISEWITQFPLMYQADGPVLFAAYGMGLQGWDSSYEFQSSPKYGTDDWFAPNAGNLPFGCWVVDSPTQIGQYPALARMIARGDVKQGDTISVRSLSMEEISKDALPFDEIVKQNGDIKSFGGPKEQASLAAGRCVVKFTDKPEPQVVPDMSKYRNGTVITSNTGQLTWDTANRGSVTINTDGTKGVVGFAQGKAEKLGNVTITSQSPYASILLTALDRGATLDKAKSALLIIVGRTESTGFSYNKLTGQMLNPGTSPLMIEPIQADVAIAGRTVAAVNILSQNGVLTNTTVPVTNGAFHIDTGKDKTIYYQVVFK